MNTSDEINRRAKWPFRVSGAVSGLSRVGSAFSMIQEEWAAMNTSDKMTRCSKWAFRASSAMSGLSGVGSATKMIDPELKSVFNRLGVFVGSSAYIFLFVASIYSDGKICGNFSYGIYGNLSMPFWGMLLAIGIRFMVHRIEKEAERAALDSSRTGRSPTFNLPIKIFSKLSFSWGNAVASSLTLGNWVHAERRLIPHSRYSTMCITALGNPPISFESQVKYSA